MPEAELYNETVLVNGKGCSFRPNTAERSVDRAKFPLMAPLLMPSVAKSIALPLESNATLPSGIAMSVAETP